ncbi:reverse transcriptase-like protein [Caldalkalibacillus mannanilyticus]|uniref:reverse transcriptase-like protein n=1 Tax=Caldalkalibacillus mannanilyticus TaxID=1418 RepID=UPI00046A7902|nr:reverse transcriptase-like protein [Caldalkalibacillus mannanilyticus]
MIKVYFDGASAGDPGPSGAGVFIIDDTGKVEQHSFYLGIMSNHEAEYHAFIKALSLCLDKQVRMVSFHTDSQLIERAVEKEFVKNKLFEPLLQEALELSRKFDLFFLKWIPTKQNHMADALAKKGIKQAKQEK